MTTQPTFTPLHPLTILTAAIGRDRPDLIATLLQNHPEVAHDRHHLEMTGLMMAALQGRLGCVELLIPLSDCTARDQHGLNAFLLAATRGHLECMAKLQPHSRGQDTDLEGNTALMLAVLKGNVEVVEKLLPLSDPARVNAKGDRAFTLALRTQQWDCADALGLLEPDDRILETLSLAPPGLLPRILTHHQQKMMGQDYLGQ